MAKNDTDFVFEHIRRLMDKGKLSFISGYFYSDERKYIHFYSRWNLMSTAYCISTPKRIPGMRDRQFKRNIEEKVKEVDMILSMYEL